MGRGLRHQGIDSGRPLAPSHNEERRPLRFEAKRTPCFGARGRAFGQFPANRRPCDPSRAFRKMTRTIVEAEQHGATKSGSQAVCLAGNGVRFVQKSRYSAAACRNKRGNAGEPTHAQNRVGTVRIIRGAAGLEAGTQAAQESDHRRRKDGRQADRRKLLARQIGMGPQGAGIDLLLRNKK